MCVRDARCELEAGDARAKCSVCGGVRMYESDTCSGHGHVHRQSSMPEASAARTRGSGLGRTDLGSRCRVLRPLLTAAFRMDIQQRTDACVSLRARPGMGPRRDPVVHVPVCLDRRPDVIQMAGK